MIKEISCPSCYDGKLPTMFPFKVLECSDCEGTGTIEADPEWQKDGEFLRQQRLYVLHMNLRNFCKQFNLDPATVSKVERGIIEYPAEWDKYYGLL